jgi:hypothetical protein
MRRPGNKPSTKKILGAVLAAGLLAAGTYAFTASNTVPGSKAGDGAGAITGYTVSNITYTADALNPTLLSSYSFDLDSAAAFVRAKPVTGQATYDVCVNTLLNTWSCPAVLGTTITSLDNLRVIATQ